VPLSPPQTLHGLTWDRTRASAAKGGQLTASAIAVSFLPHSKHTASRQFLCFWYRCCCDSKIRSDGTGRLNLFTHRRSGISLTNGTTHTALIRANRTKLFNQNDCTKKKSISYPVTTVAVCRHCLQHKLQYFAFSVKAILGSTTLHAKIKGEVHPRTGHEESEEQLSYIFFFDPRPGRFTPREGSRYPLYRRLGEPQGRSGRVRKISPPPGYFCSCFFRSVLFIHYVPLYSVSSCRLFLYNTQHERPCPQRDSNAKSQQTIGRRLSP
jgi:hypothetical protein